VTPKEFKQLETIILAYNSGIVPKLRKPLTEQQSEQLNNLLNVVQKAHKRQKTYLCPSHGLCYHIMLLGDREIQALFTDFRLSRNEIDNPFNIEGDVYKFAANKNKYAGKHGLKRIKYLQDFIEYAGIPYQGRKTQC